MDDRNTKHYQISGFQLNIQNDLWILFPKNPHNKVGRFVKENVMGPMGPPAKKTSEI